MFMVFVWLGCLYVACVASELFWSRSKALNNSQDLSAQEVMRLNTLIDGGYLSAFADFAFVLSAAVLVALTILLGWHVYLVSTAQSNIEFYQNRALAQAAAKAHETWAGNPYDNGVVRNWQLFLGLVNGRGILSVLLPSTHAPVGDGVTWQLWEKSR